MGVARSSRLTADSVAQTTVAGLLRAIPVRQRPHSEQVYGIRLSTTRQPTGGARWWMHCPQCGDRCGVLYQPRGADLGCRRCHRLYYRSQRLSTTRRLWYRAQKLYARLGATFDDTTVYRPKGMHERTFERLCEQAEDYENRATESALGLAARFIWRSGGR